MAKDNNQHSLKILAELISTVTNPAIVFVVSLAFITYRYASTTEQFVSWTAIGTLLLVGPGVLYTLGTWKKEKRFDIDITKREDRIVPLMLACLGALIGSYLISTRLDNENLLLTSNILVTMLVALTIVTFQWKISLHTATFAALATLVSGVVNPYFSLFYGGLLIVGWARFYLKQHTVAQALAGALLGTAITGLIIVVFRN